MKQVREHIREDEDLMIEFLNLIREIENAGDPSRHPDTRKEKKTEMKVEIIEMLVDIGMRGDRRDWLDRHRLPLYELSEKSDQFKKELANYLITPDTLPCVVRYPKDDDQDLLLADIGEKDYGIDCMIYVARKWFESSLSGVEFTLSLAYQFLKEFEVNFKFRKLDDGN